MLKWSVEEGRSGGRQILHVRVCKGFASRPFYLGLGISKVVIFTWLECGFSFCLNSLNRTRTAGGLALTQPQQKLTN